MITADITLPHVRQTLTFPIRPELWSMFKQESYPGISMNFEIPLRFNARFPEGYESVLRLLTDGRYTITSPTVHSPHEYFLTAGQAVPHYHAGDDMLYMPRAEQFGNDLLAWHCLFHESAHRMHLHPVPWRIRKHFTPHLKETIAESAAYAAMRTVGLPDDLERSAVYVQDWQNHDIFQQFNPSVHIRLAADIAAHLATVYNRVMNGVPNYVQV